MNNSIIFPKMIEIHNVKLFIVLVKFSHLLIKRSRKDLYELQI